MRTIQTIAYKFDELNEEAQQKAIEKFRKNNYGDEFYFDEIFTSVKAVLELFDLRTGREYTDIRTGHIEDTFLELSGSRLYTYIVNNYWEQLFKPKYIKTLDKKVFFRPFKCTYFKNREGKEFTQIYSKNFYTNDCTLTGICYDNDILQPIYGFLKNPNKNITFADLISDIESAIAKTFRNTEDWINSDEFIIEEIQANDYEFTEEGKLI